MKPKMREVTPISTYKFRLFGRGLRISPVTYESLPVPDGLSDEIYISASPYSDTDASVRADPDVASQYTLALIAAYHLICHRGLPLSELIIDVNGSPSEVRSASGGGYGVPLRIRYPIATSADTVHSAELVSHLYPSPMGKIKLVSCLRSDFFSDSALHSLLGDGDADVAGCVAFSYSDGVITARAYSPYFNVLATLPELAELIVSRVLSDGYYRRGIRSVLLSDVCIPILDTPRGRLIGAG